MKTITKRMLALAVLISIQAPLCAWKFTFVNNTDTAMELWINDESFTPKHAKIERYKSHTFDAWCLINATARYPGQMKLVKLPKKKYCKSDAKFELTKNRKGEIIATEQ